MLRNHFFYVACYQKIMLHIKCVVLASSIEQLHKFILSIHSCENEVYIVDQSYPIYPIFAIIIIIIIIIITTVLPKSDLRSGAYERGIVTTIVTQAPLQTSTIRYLFYMI